MIWEIISIAAALALLCAGLWLIWAGKVLAEHIYGFICKITAYVVEPLKIFPRWIIQKLSSLNKMRKKQEDSPWGNLAAFIIVAILFLASLAYLILCSYQSGDFWNYVGDEFLFSLPSVSVFALFSVTGGDTTMTFIEVMTETTIIGLCLYHVNKHIGDLGTGAKIFYNVALTFIGWAVSQLVSYYIFLPLLALFPIGQFLMTGDLITGLAEIPVLWHILSVLSWILGLAILILAVWLFLAVVLVAFREFVAPLPFSLLFILINSLLLNLFPDLQTEVFIVIVFAVGCACYEIYRTNVLSEIEEDAQDDAETNITSALSKCRAFFAGTSNKFKSFIRSIFTRNK